MPLFDTQHEVVQLMEDFLDAGHMKPCLSLRMGWVHGWGAGNQYGPVCDRDSFVVRPVEDGVLRRDEVYTFHGCPPDCRVYEPRPGAEEALRKRRAQKEQPMRQSAPRRGNRPPAAVVVAVIGALGLVIAAAVTGMMSSKEKAAPVATLVGQSSRGTVQQYIPQNSGTVQQQVVGQSPGSTNIQASGNVSIQMPQTNPADLRETKRELDQVRELATRDVPKAIAQDVERMTIIKLQAMRAPIPQVDINIANLSVQRVQLLFDNLLRILKAAAVPHAVKNRVGTLMTTPPPEPYKIIAHRGEEIVARRLAEALKPFIVSDPVIGIDVSVPAGTLVLTLQPQTVDFYKDGSVALR